MKHLTLHQNFTKQKGISLVENILSIVIFTFASLALISGLMGYVKMSKNSQEIQISKMLINNVLEKAARSGSVKPSGSYKPDEIDITFSSNYPELRSLNNRIRIVVDVRPRPVTFGSSTTEMKVLRVSSYNITASEYRLLAQNSIIFK